MVGIWTCRISDETTHAWNSFNKLMAPADTLVVRLCNRLRSAAAAPLQPRSWRWTQPNSVGAWHRPGPCAHLQSQSVPGGSSLPSTMQGGFPLSLVDRVNNANQLVICKKNNYGTSPCLRGWIIYTWPIHSIYIPRLDCLKVYVSHSTRWYTSEPTSIAWFVSLFCSLNTNYDGSALAIKKCVYVYKYIYIFYIVYVYIYVCFNMYVNIYIYNIGFIQNIWVHMWSLYSCGVRSASARAL